MPDLQPDIRNAVRALIIEGGAVLVLEKTDRGRGRRFALPGGAQDVGESLRDTLQRECLEEIGTRVEIGGLRFCCDYFKRRNTTPPSRRHVVEFVFDCGVPAGYRPGCGSRPDKHQLGVCWLPLEQLPGLELIPGYLLDLLPRKAGVNPVYAGTFHGQ
ncbi:NUDIX domain-containing protein [Parahaliea mediterranea]|uniref:NUDIX domain-containing protein n=1 Tax=Parahaliea mediterranea TaxID=651086 RepID=A0A939DFZ7_9GAMM|nr:NUDIX domain-containing protein [Parahaliea mediterranea]MBN7797558.1 NUDIX domain-containing protein [Parahaliea mediterranea]